MWLKVSQNFGPFCSRYARVGWRALNSPGCSSLPSWYPYWLKSQEGKAPPVGIYCRASSISILLGSYFTYRSYKCYNPHFLDCTVRINVFSIIFQKIKFSCNKRTFWDKNSTYIGKLKKIPQTVRTYNRNLKVIYIAFLKLSKYGRFE